MCKVRRSDFGHSKQRPTTTESLKIHKCLTSFKCRYKLQVH
nr:MAG TPA: hypothetical protein [Caudoviricetes sp.]